MKSITTTTIISSDVPPRWNGTPNDDWTTIGIKQITVIYIAPIKVSRFNT
ncbi:hypothetical protein MGSAQ_000368 [marine sediment metagenome]|uniref:Uncharacterized protein n=1 Tax=marine sediment metagenome TaxID=412755 RepID=A0A1B6NYU3_9ZZZZ